MNQSPATGRRLRIAQVSTLSTPVGPTGSASIEGLVYALGEELVRSGHEVTLFTSEGSVSSAEVVATLPGPYARNGAPGDWHLCEWINLARAVEESERFDVIHAHAYLWSLPLTPLCRCAMVHTTHVMPSDDDVFAWDAVPDATVTAISRYQWSALRRRPSTIVHHGIDVAQFPFISEPADYLCYLGRFLPDKGPLEAIATARALDMPIRLSGPANEYFESHVRPLLDGSNAVYVGAVAGGERAELLGNARALLYPLRAPEPFGLVMAEAMMCGTAVAALGIGAVPEVVDPGVTGMIASIGGELMGAVGACLSLDRGAVRAQAEIRFSASRMAAEYAALYESLVAGS